MANPDQTIVFKDESVTIYPNPTRYYFNLEFSKLDDIEQIEYILSDEQGKLIEQGKIEQQKTKFDLSEHRNGIYFLNILRNGEKMSWQIVKIG